MVYCLQIRLFEVKLENLQNYKMKDITSEKFMFNFKWTMSSFFILVLANILMTAVEATEMSAKRCFLYPISDDEPSPWYTIPKNHDTVVILENTPIDLPVNITIKNYHTDDLYCLLSIKSSNIRIYGECISGEANIQKLNGTIEDKTLVLHFRESMSYISVEDVVVNFNPVIADNSELNHDESESMDSEEFSKEMKPMVSDNNQYTAQITADISTDNRLHAAFGCEYDSDDECTMEFGKTIISVKDEISLLAISNSSELEGEIKVHYGTSEIKRSKPLIISLPSFDEDDDDTWMEVVTIVPSFLDREDKDSYILHLTKNLIYSPRSPGLVGTVKEKKLILDFTNTTNVRWGVPCPEKPESLFVITTIPENDAELLYSNDTNEEYGSNLTIGLLRNENSDLNNLTDPEPTEEEKINVDEPIIVPEESRSAAAKLVTGAQFVSHLVLLDFLITYYFLRFF